ncbi:MAG: hypothetical protein WDM90_02985 [Ferruginibacter sp.]
MKKILLFSLCSILALIANAQNAKPSKEETQKFLVSMLKGALGKDVNDGIYTLTKQSFSNDFDSYSSLTVTDRGTTDGDEVSLIDWAKLDMKYLVNQFGSKDVIQFSCYFKNKIKVVNTDIFGNVKTKMKDSFDFYVPTEKEESVWKACVRLRDLAKEETKDPFAN